MVTTKISHLPYGMYYHQQNNNIKEETVNSGLLVSINKYTVCKLNA